MTSQVQKAMNKADGKNEVHEMLQCIRVYCFQGPFASVKSGLTAVGAVAIGLDSKVGQMA